MKTDSDLSKLTVYIEENLRAANGVGVRFVDPRKIRDRVITRQNHVIFGRRGAGKTTLLGSIAGETDFITVYINLEDAKGSSLSTNLIAILVASFGRLREEIACKKSTFNLSAHFLRGKIKKVERALTHLLDADDSEALRHDEPSQAQEALEAQTNADEPAVASSTGADRSRLTRLNRDIIKYKKLLADISRCLDNKPVYLALDDFYYVSRSQQPELLDYFHRLTKDSQLYLKVATVKDRSTLYRVAEESHWGIELGHDAHEIDIDYTLQKFSEMEEFLNDLLTTAKRDSGAAIEIEACFKDEGFKQLCLASEGIPRNFLALFVRIANKYKDAGLEGPFIGSNEVLEELDPERLISMDVCEVPLRKKKKGFIGRLFDFLKGLFKKNEKAARPS